MILGPEELLRLVKKDQLVSDLSERELTNPEGAGFDLRVAEVYTIKGGAFLGKEERKTPEVELKVAYDESKNNSIILKPGDFYIFKTIESVNLPKYLTANFKPRSTTFRSGLFMRTGNVAPGYHGPLNFAVKNEGPVEVEIEMGARVVHIQFEEVLGGGNMYRGQWNGGRTTTDKKETQV